MPPCKKCVEIRQTRELTDEALQQGKICKRCGLSEQSLNKTPLDFHDRYSCMKQNQPHDFSEQPKQQEGEEPKYWVDGIEAWIESFIDNGEDMDNYWQGSLNDFIKQSLTRAKIDAVGEVLREMYDTLPDYIDEKYPKGVAKDRGEATTKIVMFLLETAKKKRIQIALPPLK